MSCALPALSWLAESKASNDVSARKKKWLNVRTLVVASGLIVAIVAFQLLTTAPAPNLQTPSAVPQIPDDGGHLSHEDKTRLERLAFENSLVVIGKLQDGKPTGNAFAHLFATEQILKGKTAKLNVLLSHKNTLDPDNSLANPNTVADLPRLEAGEYLLILRPEEVISSFTTTIFGFRVTPEQTFNYFILRDGQQHAAWQLGSPEAEYIRKLFRESTGGEKK